MVLLLFFFFYQEARVVRFGVLILNAKVRLFLMQKYRYINAYTCVTLLIYDIHVIYNIHNALSVLDYVEILSEAQCMDV